MLIEEIIFVLFSLNVLIFGFVGLVVRDLFIVILLVLEGFWWNYMFEVDILNMDFIVEIGVKVFYVENVFLIVVMLNFYMIVIGLYLESYGIIVDKMFDFVFKVKFDSSNNELEWWNDGELIWVIN